MQLIVPLIQIQSQLSIKEEDYKPKMMFACKALHPVIQVAYTKDFYSSIFWSAAT
jgi:hypothetical protein